MSTPTRKTNERFLRNVRRMQLRHHKENPSQSKMTAEEAKKKEKVTITC